jgi:hypothetical protein
MRARIVLFFTLLFCVGVLGVTGQVVTKAACTEYKAAYLYSDGVARSFTFNSLDGHVELMPFQIGGRKAVDISTGFNRITILDDQGYVWLNDAGLATATRWNTDATGAAFDNNVSIYGYFYTYLSIRGDGTIWYWGGDDYKFYGGVAVAAPVKLNQPAGVKFVKLATGNSILGLTSTGDVYEWDKGSLNYTKVTLPRPATDVAASHMAFNIAVVPDDTTISKMGYPYAWGSESPYWGGDGTSYPTTNPQALKTLWKMTAPIQKITANQNVIHYIDANNDLYGIGDNPNGEIGNGQELVNHADKYPTPYAWSWTKYEMLTGAPPIHVSAGTKFKNIFTGNTFTFYHYALDVNDSLYFWGRNKSFVGGDGAVNNNESTWPNALDVLTPSRRTPMGIKPTQTIGYNFTMYTLKADAKQTITGAVTNLTATATPSTLTASGVPNYGYTIVKYQWTKVSGPTSYTLATPNAVATSASGLTTGTYIFSIQTTDNNTGTITAYDTVVVNGGGSVSTGPLGASAGANQTITLPTSSVTLTGTGLETNGTIAGYQWTQVSGPNTAVFSSAKTAQTAASGLIQGSYVFQLTVTDATGATASAQTTVTVNAAAAATTTFTVSAGANMTITLPTNSATITGVATVVNDTLSTCKWTQVSGPGTATITNGGTITPTVGSLVQGSYVFQVTITDKKGTTASSQMTLTVNAATAITTFNVYAGSNMTITLPTSSATITGQTTIINATLASTKWTQVSGPNTAVITNGGTITPTVGSLVQGSYVFQVTITSTAGQTASSQMTLTVNPAPYTFTVTAGSDITITLPTSSATIVGSATLVNETLSTCKWTQVSGPNTAVITNGGTITPTVSSLIQGSYVFQVTITSTDGKTASAQMTLTVDPVPAGTFLVDAGPDMAITLPISSVTIDGVCTVKGVSISSCRWSESSGPANAVITNSGTITPTASKLVAGVYVFKVVVTSTDGRSVSDSMKVTVTAASAADVKSSNLSASMTLDSTDTRVSLLVYPNPVYVDQQITVDGQNVKAGVVKFMIYDISGRVVKQLVLNNQYTTLHQSIPLTGLTRGVYILTVSIEGEAKPRTFKFIIQ